MAIHLGSCNCWGDWDKRKDHRGHIAVPHGKVYGEKAGLISTVANYIGDVRIEADHTTPDAITVNRLLSEMVEAGCTFAAMEVSSHACAQHRIAGLHFSGGIFTNLTRDHLDYHKTVDEYLKAKNHFSTSCHLRHGLLQMLMIRLGLSCFKTVGQQGAPIRCGHC